MELKRDGIVAKILKHSDPTLSWQLRHGQAASSCEIASSVIVWCIQLVFLVVVLSSMFVVASLGLAKGFMGAAFVPSFSTFLCGAVLLVAIVSALISLIWAATKIANRVSEMHYNRVLSREQKPSEIAELWKSFRDKVCVKVTMK